ncbi:MAG: TRAP transporter TAXI family solute receptor [Granulosicoccus sp.]|jgi:TRAP transporter TAXI family solute receptor
MKLFKTLATTGTVVVASLLSSPVILAADLNLSIGSCPVGCTAYTWSAGIAEVINKNVEGVRVTAEETKGYVANIKLMQKDQIEISMATSLSSYQAYAASGPYEGSEKGAILSWMAIAPVAMHVITLKDGPVQSLADLKGKRVGMGQPGGVSMLDADAMMNVLGLTPDTDFKPFRIRLGGMADGLADGNLDAALWNGSFPLPPVVKLTAGREIQLIPISDEFFDKMRAEYPPYFRLSIPGGLYKGVDEPTPTFGLANGMVLSKDVPEDIVYNMTKAIFENLEGLKAVHPAFGRVSKESVLNGFGAPLHPGALKYYREIGVPGIEDFVTRTAE